MPKLLARPLETPRPPESELSLARNGSSKYSRAQRTDVAQMSLVSGRILVIAMIAILVASLSVLGIWLLRTPRRMDVPELNRHLPATQPAEGTDLSEPAPQASEKRVVYFTCAIPDEEEGGSFSVFDLAAGEIEVAVPQILGRPQPIGVRCKSGRKMLIYIGPHGPLELLIVDVEEGAHFNLQNRRKDCRSVKVEVRNSEDRLLRNVSVLVKAKVKLPSEVLQTARGGLSSNDVIAEYRHRLQVEGSPDFVFHRRALMKSGEFIVEKSLPQSVCEFALPGDATVPHYEVEYEGRTYTSAASFDVVSRVTVGIAKK